MLDPPFFGKILTQLSQGRWSGIGLPRGSQYPEQPKVQGALGMGAFMGFPWGYPNSWMVNGKSHENLTKWMIWGPISGNVLKDDGGLSQIPPVSSNGGTPIAGWLMENCMKMDDEWGTTPKIPKWSARFVV